MESRKYILNFHSVYSDSICFHKDPVYSIHVAKLKKILDLIDSKPNVLVTFDDGHLSDSELVLPILHEKKIDTLFFILGHEVETNIKKKLQTQLLSSKGYNIGCHGYQHLDLTNLNANDLQNQLTQAKDILENLIQKEVVDFSLPYGKYNQFVLDKIYEIGFKRIYTTDSFKNNKISLLSRLNVKKNTPLFSLKMYLKQDYLLINYYYNSYFYCKNNLKKLLL